MLFSVCKQSLNAVCTMPVGQSQSYNFAINSHMRQCDEKQQEDTCKG